MRHILTIDHKHKSSGFTIVELLVSTILSGIVVTIFVATLMSMLKTAAIEKTLLELSQENQLALNTIERDIRMATAFDTTTVYTPFVDKYGPANTDQTWTGSWSYKGTDSDHRALILRLNATSKNAFNTSRLSSFVDGRLVNPYAEQNINLNCTLYNITTAPTGALAYNPILPYYLIYFVRDSNLYRRTLTDSTTPLCNSQYQKQSCPSVDTTPDATCKASDELIASNVSSFSVTYNTVTRTSGVTTVQDINAYASSSPDIFNDISSSLVTLKLQKYVYGTNRNVTLSTRVSRIN